MPRAFLLGRIFERPVDFGYNREAWKFGIILLRRSIFLLNKLQNFVKVINKLSFLKNNLKNDKV